MKGKKAIPSWVYSVLVLSFLVLVAYCGGQGKEYTGPVTPVGQFTR